MGSLVLEGVDFSGAAGAGASALFFSRSENMEAIERESEGGVQPIRCGRKGCCGRAL
jgi:hypothetical protein